MFLDAIMIGFPGQLAVAWCGDITGQFISPDKNIKKRYLEKAVKESTDHVKISDATKEIMLSYEDAVKCKQVDKG